MLGFGTTGQFAIGEVGAASAETVLLKWYMALSEPVRLKRGLAATQQQTLALYPAPLVSFSWFGALSEPKRNPAINPASYRQDFWMQMAPSPFVAAGWFNWLSEPVRKKPGLQAAQHPFFFYQSNPLTITPFAWFGWLSEPVRIKPGLKAHLQKVQTEDPRWIPDPSTLVEGWFSWLSEPKRFLKGLNAPYQLAYTSHPRVLPPANVTVTILAPEVNNDQAIIAVNVVKSNPPVTAVVSIIEIGNGLSPTAVIEH